MVAIGTTTPMGTYSGNSVKQSKFTPWKTADTVAAAPTAPPPLTYEQLVEKQSNAGRDIALGQVAANRPTEITPYGSKTWSLRSGADPNNPQVGDWISTEQLNAQQQQLLDAGTARAGMFGDLATSALGELSATGLNTGFDRRAVEDALFKNLTRNYGEQFGRQEATLRDRLVNQGLDENSEAFRRQVEDFDTFRQGAYDDATSRAVFGAGDAAIQDQQIIGGGLMNIGNLSQMAGATVPKYAGMVPMGNWGAPDYLGARTAQDTAENNAASISASKSNAKREANAGIFGSALGFAGGLLGF